MQGRQALLETEGREEDLQLPILQHAAHWTLEGDAAEQLEALFKQETENKFQTPRLTLWSCVANGGRTTSSARPARTWCSGATPTRTRTAALRHLRFLEANGLLESKAETTENGTEIALSPRNSRPVTAVRTVVGVPGVGHWGHFRRLGQC